MKCLNGWPIKGKMMIKTRVLLLIAVVMVLLSGCSQNPLLGSWEIDDNVSDVKSSIMGMTMPFALIEFKKDSIIVGASTSVDVSYKVDGDQVVVSAKQTGNGEIYQILENGERMKKELPGVGAIIYKKVK